ncbi:MAG: carboxylesterase family protein [Acidobacteria bacterium]|nr:carboxylesterase family protein [Acidobacteriota bacterium]
MKSAIRVLLFGGLVLSSGLLPARAATPDRVKTSTGVVEGPGRQASGVRAFKGIPYAAPPVGELRWRPPQASKSWEGVRHAEKFGPRCMQHPVFGDMNFRSDGMSEDCLYLNVWTPAKSEKDKLPVLVYFYGGGFIAGDGSEPRYDGEALARRGIVTVTLNYRLGLFGFFAHPELSKESTQHASGNYGLLDQAAALRWVHENIAAFGGDPRRITVAGESAGSASVSAQMASPLSRDFIAGAIGESGSVLSTMRAVPLAQAEEVGAKFATEIGASSLAALRALPTEKLMEATGKQPFRFPIAVDGYFFNEPPHETYAAGRQAHVPLLVGWNSEEMTWRALLGGNEPTPENFEKVVRGLYGARAEEALKLYAAKTGEEVVDAATDLAGDRFIGYSTWKWFDLHAQTGGRNVYRYFYARPRPPMTPEMGDARPGLAGGVVRGQNSNAMAVPPARGAVHSAEIEYALGNLSTNKVYAWTPDDYKVSEQMQSYFANFIKKGDPNGAGLPAWPAVTKGGAVRVMRLDVDSRVEDDKHRARYLFLDQF